MRNLGLGFLAAGFLAGAYLTVMHPENRVDWLWFAPCLVVAAAGVAMARSASHREATRDSALAEKMGALRQSLARIAKNAAALDDEKQGIDVYDLHARIDATFVADLNVFVDARKSLIPVYGLDAYADVMSEFAAGERYLNRVWSASVDGYIDECHEYLRRAREQFGVALRKLDSLGS